MNLLEVNLNFRFFYLLVTTGRTSPICRCLFTLLVAIKDVKLTIVKFQMHVLAKTRYLKTSTLGCFPFTFFWNCCFIQIIASYFKFSYQHFRKWISISKSDFFLLCSDSKHCIESSKLHNSSYSKLRNYKSRLFAAH